MNLARFGVNNPVIANLCMFAIIAAGVIFGGQLRREFFPEIRPNQVLIVAPYPGAAPDEIEKSLAIKIEDQVADLDDVEEINTTIGEGVASIIIEMVEGTDIDAAVAEVKRTVDALQDLPEQAERITVAEIEPAMPVIIVKLYGDADERLMKDALYEMRDDLRSLEGMGEVRMFGMRTDEISVEVRPGAMLEHNVSLPLVAERIREGMVELPGGTVRAPGANVSLRTLGAEERSEEVREIVVKGDPSGQVVRVEDIARVTQGFEDIDLRQRFNGSNSVALNITKKGDEDIVEMAAMIKAYIAGRKGEEITLTPVERLKTLLKRPGDDSPVSSRLRAYELGLSRTTPLPGELGYTTDLARFVEGRLDLLTRNAFWGGVLVFATLVVLLNWRTSFWVAVGLGVSLMGTLAAMHFFNISLNLITMFGLIVVMGLLVDDAIVVAENITAHHERGVPVKEAAINGTSQVGWPVIATVLTTICAFLPLGLVEGTIGDMLETLPWVVGVALAVSLIEALFILPTHMAHSLKEIDAKHEPGSAGWLQRLEFRFDEGRDAFFQKLVIPVYLRVLAIALRFRYLTLAVAVAILIGSLGMVAGGRLKFIFFEAEDAETINIELRLPVGTPVARTDELVRRIEAAALDQPEIDSINAQIGAIFDLNRAGGDQSNAHIAQVLLELAPVEDREALGQRSSSEVIIAIREQLGELPGIKSLRMSGVSGGPEGPAITLAVVGDEPRRIDRAVVAIKELLSEFDGVYDISDDADKGQQELRISLRDGAAQLGFTTASLGRQVQGMVFGIEAHTFPGKLEDVDVRVMLPREDRRSIASIEQQYIFTPMGDPVPLAEVARIEQADGYSTIKRLDRRRTVTVTADVDRAIAIPEEIMGAVAPDLLAIQAGNPGIQIIERGRQKDVNDSFSTLPIGMSVSFGLIYITLAWLFKSYVQPIVVMTAIPFATIGMIWGHLILGYTMTFLSLIGFVALAGVVVNDSLIFMEFYNEQRRKGADVPMSALAAGKARVRAIFLTTVTTVLGLTPLMLEKSLQARFLIRWP